MATPVKAFKSYADQVALLVERGMDVGDEGAAAKTLESVSYYRLSGYWYPFRQIAALGRADSFYPGTSLGDVMKLYNFDSRLRAGALSQLAPIELKLRALLGHELGREHETAHLDPSYLNAQAQAEGGVAHQEWLVNYDREVARSHEDFVKHHRQRYGGAIPVWAAVEVLDWGSTTRLYNFAPRTVQEAVSSEFGLTAPQLTSWMRSLGLIRNISAHHGRLFNRDLQVPKLPAPGVYPDLDSAGSFNRLFGQLSLVQHLNRRLSLGNPRMLPAVLATFPSVKAVPLSHTGAPEDWALSPLWLSA